MILKRSFVLFSGAAFAAACTLIVCMVVFLSSCVKTADGVRLTPTGENILDQMELVLCDLGAPLVPIPAPLQGVVSSSTVALACPGSQMLIKAFLDRYTAQPDAGAAVASSVPDGGEKVGSGAAAMTASRRTHPMVKTKSGLYALFHRNQQIGEGTYAQACACHTEAMQSYLDGVQ